MAKFKKGDKVGYRNASSEICGPLVVSSVKENGDVWFTKGTWLSENKLFLWASVGFIVQENTGDLSLSWDYAEADRLEQAAKDAIKEYNEYVQRQPKKVYLPMYLPD